jgi:hypothetical protein
MHTLLQTAVAVGFVALALLDSGHALAACAPGSGGCKPSLDEARPKMERLLDAAYRTPHSLGTLDRLDARRLATQGRETYEMRILAVVTYSGDTLECRIRSCPELRNYLVETNKRAKKARIAGWLFFERTKQGWR